MGRLESYGVRDAQRVQFWCLYDRIFSSPMKAGDEIIDAAGRTWTVLSFQHRESEALLRDLGQTRVPVGGEVHVPVIAATLRLKTSRTQ